MTVLLIALILVVLVDQVLKSLVLHRLRHESISLGLLGAVRSVQTQMWMARTPYRLKLGVIWTCWIFGASALAIISTLLPSSMWFCALLLGGSLSHTIETSWRGSICDYVCLRFWPAFNIADVAITVGAMGLALNLFMAMTSAAG